jgi:hypothetical protein
VVSGLLPLVKALPTTSIDVPNNSSKGKGRELNEYDVEALERFSTWISDWHLISYLDEQGILGPVRVSAGVSRVFMSAEFVFRRGHGH